MMAALLALLTFTVVGQAEDRDRPAKKDTTTSAGQNYYQGKIQTVDADKRTVMLSDARHHRGTKGGTSGKGSGTTGRAGDRAADRADTKATGKKMTFTLSRDAKITLDGKTAELKDLKSGQYARVYVAGKTGTGSSGTGKDTGGTGKDTAGTGKATADKDTTGTGRDTKVMMAQRIEASTKAFPKGTGTGGTESKSGRD